MYVFMHACMHESMSACIDICVCIYIYIYMYTHIHMCVGTQCNARPSERLEPFIGASMHLSYTELSDL